MSAVYEKMIDLFQRAGIKEYLHVNYDSHYEIVAQSKNHPVAFTITNGKITSVIVWDAYDSIEDAMFGISENIIFSGDDLENAAICVELCKLPERYTFPKQPEEAHEQDEDSKINVDDTMLDIDTESFDYPSEEEE